MYGLIVLPCTLVFISQPFLEIKSMYFYRYFLQDKDPSSPVYYGRHFKPYVKNGYMSGGAGYVLSKEALKVCNLCIFF